MSCSCECGQPRRPMACGCACQCGCSCERDENRPGLDAVRYRDGAYDAALLRMRERLSGSDLPGLRALTARAVDEAVDPAIALLDSWACLSEILSFYNERAVNESFLRTCIERRSALELARLVGYAPRPGVAADAYLAFTLDDTNKEAVLQIPTGTRAYSQPEPGETMQPFETDEALTGRPRWSAMRPRLTQPQQIVQTRTRRLRVNGNNKEIWIKGITTGLVPGSVLIFESGTVRYGRAVAHVEPFPKMDQTRVTLQQSRVESDAVQRTDINLDALAGLVARPSLYTAGRESFVPDPAAIFVDGSYAPLSLLGSAYPELRTTLGDALGGTTPAGPTGVVTIYAMRVKAALHGHNAPLFPIVDEEGVVDDYVEWNVDGTGAALQLGNGDDVEITEHPRLLTGETSSGLTKRQITLDAVYDQIIPGSLVAIVSSPPEANEEEPSVSDITPLSFENDRIFVVQEVTTVSRVRFNLPSRVTRLTLDKDWPTGDELNFSSLRRIVVYAQSEALALAERPIPDAVKADKGTDYVISLDGYYPGLQPGRRLIVTGERADLGGITGVRGTELAMIAAVSHRAEDDKTWATRDTIHTYLTLAEPGLRYRYKRDTVTFYGNVAHATHGESRAEVLGSGDATRALQVFPLKQTPLTYVSAPTPSGIENTLEVHVNDLRWREAPNPAAVGPDERRYVLRTDDEAKTSVITGLGVRLPTGRDNVRAVYRSGIGRAGNVKSGQISVLASRPNGVMGVTNPLATSGGADRDDLEQIRTRTPIGLAALDRLVSAADFVDFTRAFAGIGKAGVSCTGAGGTAVADCATGVTNLTLTIAGEDDIPIASNSALVRNLTEALIRYGDLMWDITVVPRELRTRNTPQVTVEIGVRDARLIAIRAQIRLQPDYLWEKVLPAIEAALIAEFGFDARELGQALDPGAVIATIQKVRGVAYVDLQNIGAIDPGTVEQPKLPGEIAAEALAVLGDPVLTNMPGIIQFSASEIAYIAPNAAGTLLLTPWKDTGP